MTAQQIKGTNFLHVLRYHFAKLEKGVAEVLDHNFTEASEPIILKEIAENQKLRPRLVKFFYHTSINFAASESVSRTLMKQIGNEYLRDNGFIQQPYIIFAHYDTEHPHFHIVVSRIGSDGQLLTDSHDYFRSERVLRALERKYNLFPVNFSRNFQRRVFTRDERMRPESPRKTYLKCLLDEILTSGLKLSVTDFIERLAAKHVTVAFNQATTGYVSGITYTFDGFTITGSKLGNAYKWSSVKAAVHYQHERDKAFISLYKMTLHVAHDVPSAP